VSSYKYDSYCILAVLETKGILIVRNIALSFGYISSTWIFFFSEVVVCVCDKRNAYIILKGRVEMERGLFKHTGRYGMLILKCILKK